MTGEHFKILGFFRQPIHGGSGRWPEPGVWHRVEQPLRPCAHGLHVCRVGDLPRWVRPGAVVWRVDIDDRGGIAEPDKVVVCGARLVESVGTITTPVLQTWALDCAERVVHLADDSRCGEAIRVARLHMRGLASKREMAAASAAARGAARAARAAWAAWDAGDAAAMAARAAWAAGDAGDAAARAAWDAGDAAARAAWAAWDAAMAAERDWQGRRLLELIGGAA